MPRKRLYQIEKWKEPAGTSQITDNDLSTIEKLGENLRTAGGVYGGKTWGDREVGSDSIHKDVSKHLPESGGGMVIKGWADDATRAKEEV